jgi:hypothetical protein
MHRPLLEATMPVLKMSDDDLTAMIRREYEDLDRQVFADYPARPAVIAALKMVFNAVIANGTHLDAVAEDVRRIDSRIPDGTMEAHDLVRMCMQWGRKTVGAVLRSRPDLADACRLDGSRVLPPSFNYTKLVAMGMAAMTVAQREQFVTAWRDELPNVVADEKRGCHALFNEMSQIPDEALDELCADVGRMSAQEVQAFFECEEQKQALEEDAATGFVADHRNMEPRK